MCRPRMIRADTRVRPYEKNSTLGAEAGFSVQIRRLAGDLMGLDGSRPSLREQIEFWSWGRNRAGGAGHPGGRGAETGGGQREFGGPFGLDLGPELIILKGFLGNDTND